jgi:hypothetical protein
MSASISPTTTIFADELLRDPRFNSESSTEVGAVFDELAARVGWGEASRAWQLACSRSDHADV